MARCKNIGGLTGSTGGTPGGGGGDDPPHWFTATEKGKGMKVLAMKRKASDREAEIAEAVEAPTAAAEAVGCSGALRIGSDLAPAQRHAVLKTEQWNGTPPGTIMLGGRPIRIDVREPGHEET